MSFFQSCTLRNKMTTCALKLLKKLKPFCRQVLWHLVLPTPFVSSPPLPHAQSFPGHTTLRAVPQTLCFWVTSACNVLSALLCLANFHSSSKSTQILILVSFLLYLNSMDSCATLCSMHYTTGGQLSERRRDLEPSRMILRGGRTELPWWLRE